MRCGLEVEIGWLDVPHGEVRVLSRQADACQVEAAARAYEAAGGNVSEQTLRELGLDDRYGLLQHGEAGGPVTALTLPLEAGPGPQQVRVLGCYAPDGTLLGVTLDFRPLLLGQELPGGAQVPGEAGQASDREAEAAPEDGEDWPAMMLRLAPTFQRGLDRVAQNLRTAGGRQGDEARSAPIETVQRPET